jgi:branched-chain amino acid transport system permease protein
MMKFPQPISYGRLYRGPLILAVLAAGLPLLARGPYEYLLPLTQLCGIYAIIVTGLTLLMGFTGQVSLGHAGFYALGAYSAGVAASAYHAPIWLAVPIALAAGGLLAFIAGFTILRLRGHYLALATLCIGVIIHEVINKSTITGGAAGLYGLPQIDPFGLVGESALAKVYLIWAIVLVVVLWAVHLTESPAGRALKAIHGDEDAAESLGVSAFSVKLKVFVASGVLAALAGALYAFVYTPSYLGPEEFGLMFSVTLVIMVVIGGMGSVWGGLAGAVLLTGLHEAITLFGERIGSTDTGKYEQLAFGLILVLIMVFSRNGLLPGLKRLTGIDRILRIRA